MLQLENFYYIMFISWNLKVIKIREVTRVQTR